MAAPAMTPEEAEQRRRVRRSAILLGLLAAAFYLGFILATGLRGQ